VEYFLGSLSTFVIFIFCLFIFFKQESNYNIFEPIKYRQSHIHELIKDALPIGDVFIDNEIKKRQSSNHEEKTNIKVIILEDQAYWVKDNIFYVADFKNNEIDKNSVRTVDTMSMDKVQLDKMFFIIDKLTGRDKNDSGGSGK